MKFPGSLHRTREFSGHSDLAVLAGLGQVEFGVPGGQRPRQVDELDVELLGGAAEDLERGIGVRLWDLASESY